MEPSVEKPVGRRASFGKDRLVFAGIIGAFVCFRLWIVFTGRCLLDSDEGVFGLMSMDFLKGRFSVFFYGQDYMGSFQAFASLPFILLFGATPLALRITAIVEGILVLLCWRRILGKWGLPGAWPIFGLLFALPQEFVLTWTLKSRGVIETLLVGSTWILILTDIILSDREFDKQLARWSALGIVTGIGWWINQMILFLYLPGVIMFLSSRESINRAIPFRRGEGSVVRYTAVVLMIILFWIFIIVLITGGTTIHKSEYSRLAYDSRHFSAAGFVFWAVVYFALRNRIPLPRWPLVVGIGVVLGFSPALCRIFTSAEIKSIASVGEHTSYLLKMISLFLITGGAFIGLQDRYLSSVGVPLFPAALVPCIYVCSVVLLFIDLPKGVRAGKGFSLLETFLAAALPISVLPLGLTIPAGSFVTHYAVYAVFFLILVLARFLAHCRSLNRPAALLAAAVIIGINVNSVAKIPPVPVIPATMVPTEDERMLEFLLDKDITAACTSLGDVANGYWEAYRLSFESRGRIAFHPPFNTPRIDNYREILRNSDKCAVVTPRPETITEIFRRNNVSFQEDTFGSLTVIWGFDKKRVDELGLIEYRRSLLESK